MFFKPLWYKMLPSSVKPINDNVIEKIKDFRKGYKLTNIMIVMGITTSRWAVRRIQKFCLEQNKARMPNASECELWTYVLASRFEVKLRSPANTDPFAKPLLQEEIRSRMKNIDNIVSNFKSFNDVVDYVVKMDEEENRFCDPSGMQSELDDLLETA
ncbi:hypothetical protein KAW08_05785 [bacterium]|nr:hypothetical protein [bacterium]